MPGTSQLRRAWYRLFNKPKKIKIKSSGWFQRLFPACLTEAPSCPCPPPQLHITVSPDKVKMNVDCEEVAERPVKAANNITLDGYEVLGKMVKSGGGRRQSATVRRIFSRRILSCFFFFS